MKTFLIAFFTSTFFNMGIRLSSTFLPKTPITFNFSAGATVQKTKKQSIVAVSIWPWAKSNPMDGHTGCIRHNPGQLLSKGLSQSSSVCSNLARVHQNSSWTATRIETHFLTNRGHRVLSNCADPEGRPSTSDAQAYQWGSTVSGLLKSSSSEKSQGRTVKLTYNSCRWREAVGQL